MEQIFAITTRGLEGVSADEMADFPGLRITASSYRRIEAEYNGSLAALLSLRTVDDVFLTLAHWAEVVPQRSALAQIGDWSRLLNLDRAIKLISEPRSIPAEISFSVTVNFVGKRNYSAEEVKKSVAAGVTGRLGWRYGGEDETGINIRVFIEHADAYVGIRLGQHPLHSRAYKQSHIAGSLKPSVAAGMLLLAEAAPGSLVLDPFCGAGTIPIEASWMGLRAVGGDNSLTALAASQENIRQAGAQVELGQWDGRSLPLAGDSVDFVVSNLPWGRQVQVDDQLSDQYLWMCAEVERVLCPQGRAVVLTNLPELLVFQHLVLKKRLEISLFGQNPSILIYSR